MGSCLLQEFESHMWVLKVSGAVCAPSCAVVWRPASHGNVRACRSILPHFKLPNMTHLQFLVCKEFAKHVCK